MSVQNMGLSMPYGSMPIAIRHTIEAGDKQSFETEIKKLKYSFATRRAAKYYFAKKNNQEACAKSAFGTVTRN